MKKKCFLVLLCIMLLPISPVHAYDVPSAVRVGLKYASTAVEEIEILSEQGFSVGYYDDRQFISLGMIGAQSVTVLKLSGDVSLSNAFGSYDEARASSETGFVLYKDGQYYIIDYVEREGWARYTLPATTVGLKANGNLAYASDSVPLGLINQSGGFLTIGGKVYRGGAEIRRQSDSDMTVINVVPLNEYLYGVVPGEMPAYFEMEALKVQAVCARNYTLINLGKYGQYGFDVTDNTSSQMYIGVSGENERTNAAVDETASKVLLYEGALAQTYYSSMSGGATENVKNVWGSEIPYLCGVDDPYENADSIQGGTWVVELTPQQIKEDLASWGIDVGDILTVRVTEYSDAGGVVKLLVTGTNGEHTFEREATRNIFGFRSQKYTIDGAPSTTPDEPQQQEVEQADRYPNSLVAKQAKSFLTLRELFLKPSLIGKEVVITETKPPQTIEGGPNENGVFVFRGRGYGHGLGMSQWGAQGMAQAGFSYADILTHYFPGTYLQE